MKNYKIENNFIILSILGKGAFSIVYKVKRIKNDKIYALKKVSLKSLKNKEMENALNEIRILASIKNRNIIGYKEAFIEKKTGDLCIVMDFAGGGDLSQKIKECKKLKKRIPEALIIKYFYQLTVALHELHIRKIIHRDLKTANVMIDQDDQSVKLGDMNVSKVVKNIFAYTQTGTPYYASPEVWRDDPYNTKTDIWSLGCVLFELCMLRPPFIATDMDELFGKVQKREMQKFDVFYSKQLQSAILKLLTVNPHLRPSTEKILKNSIFKEIKKKEKSRDESDPFDDIYISTDLMDTIRPIGNLKNLQKILPPSQYTERLGLDQNLTENNAQPNFNEILKK